MRKYINVFKLDVFQSTHVLLDVAGNKFHVPAEVKKDEAFNRAAGNSKWSLCIEAEGGKFKKVYCTNLERFAKEGKPVVQGEVPFLQSYFTGTAPVVDDTPVAKTQTQTPPPAPTAAETKKDILAKAESLKPGDLVIDPLKWKYLVWAVLNGENALITGESGSGKTMAVQCLQKAFPNRPFYTIPLGATQDPRASLIGNVHYSQEAGTYFSNSTFIKAIQTENAIIYLDEITRMHPEAGNILMTPLDKKQRFIRLDEEDGSPTINVAPGVCFLATANIGTQYTSTRKLDRALMDRFGIRIEMDLMTAEVEEKLLLQLFPELSREKAKAISKIAGFTRTDYMSSNPRLQTIISTRDSVQIASMMVDGFKLKEAAEMVIYPLFDADGAENSERAYVSKEVQKYSTVDDEVKKTVDGMFGTNQNPDNFKFTNDKPF